MAESKGKAGAATGGQETKPAKATNGAKAGRAKSPRPKAAGAKPGAKARPRSPGRAAAAQGPERVARSYFDAVTARDPERMAGHWHPEGVDDIVPVGIFRGPEEVRALFSELFAAVPDMEFRVTRITADERIAAVEWRMTGTFSGAPFQGIEPTGRRLELRGVDCLEVEDGQIVRNTAHYDGASFARAIGMLPPRDSGAEKAMVRTFNATTKLRRSIANRRGG